MFVRLPGCLTQHYLLDESMLRSTSDGLLREVPFHVSMLISKTKLKMVRRSVGYEKTSRKRYKYCFCFLKMFSSHTKSLAAIASITIRACVLILLNMHEHLGLFVRTDRF